MRWRVQPLPERAGASLHGRLSPIRVSSELDRVSLVSINRLFQEAVAMIGSGDVPALERLLTDHPELATERLTAPGPWLQDKIGGALDGFFKDPYLLWFVSEDVPVLGRLPENIADVARAILRSARGAPGFQEQLDSAVPSRTRPGTGRRWDGPNTTCPKGRTTSRRGDMARSPTTSVPAIRIRSPEPRPARYCLFICSMHMLIDLCRIASGTSTTTAATGFRSMLRFSETKGRARIAKVSTRRAS